MQALITHITKLATNPSLEGLDVWVGINVNGKEIALRIAQGELVVHGPQLDVSADTEWTIYFDSETTALALLRGDANPIELFMSEKLRSSGYIVRTFEVIRALSLQADR